jgi:hypothetical protein
MMLGIESMSQISGQSGTGVSPVLKNYGRDARATLRLPILIVAMTLVCAHIAHADGGSVQLQSAAGPFQVTLFSEPGVIRAGLVDLSVFVQTSPHGEPVLDADVTLGLSPLDDSKIGQGAAWAPPACISGTNQELTRIKANRATGPNLLLYSALVRIPTEGRWQLSVLVHCKNIRGMTQAILNVEPPAAPWTNYWHLFAFPPAAIIGFLLRQKILQRPRRKIGSNEIVP